MYPEHASWQPPVFKIPVVALPPGSHYCTGSLRGGKWVLYVDGIKWTIPLVGDSRLPRTHRRWHSMRLAWKLATVRHVNLSDEDTEPPWWGRWRWTIYHLND